MLLFQWVCSRVCNESLPTKSWRFLSFLPEDALLTSVVSMKYFLIRVRNEPIELEDLCTAATSATVLSYSWKEKVQVYSFCVSDRLWTLFLENFYNLYVTEFGGWEINVLQLICLSDTLHTRELVFKATNLMLDLRSILWDVSVKNHEEKCWFLLTTSMSPCPVFIGNLQCKISILPWSG